MKTSSKNSEVLVHRQLLVAADEAADRLQAQQRGGVHHAHHEVVLLLAQIVVVVEQVVEERDVGDADPRRLHRGEHALGARLVERLAQIERVRDRVEHRLGRHVGLGRVQGGRDLDVRAVELARELAASPRWRGPDPRRGSGAA